MCPLKKWLGLLSHWMIRKRNHPQPLLFSGQQQKLVIQRCSGKQRGMNEVWGTRPFITRRTRPPRVLSYWHSNHCGSLHYSAPNLKAATQHHQSPVLILACQCRKRKRRELNPWIRKIVCSKKLHLTTVFLPGKFHGQRSPTGYSLWGCRSARHDSEFTHTHTHTYILGHYNCISYCGNIDLWHYTSFTYTTLFLLCCISTNMTTTKSLAFICYHTVNPLYPIYLLLHPFPIGNHYSALCIYMFILVCLVCSFAMLVFYILHMREIIYLSFWV